MRDHETILVRQKSISRNFSNWEFFLDADHIRKNVIRDADHIRKNDDGKRRQEFYSGYEKSRNFCDMAEISVILSENLLFWLKPGSNAIMTNIRKMRNFIPDILI